MILGILKEHEEETRISITPDTVSYYQSIGLNVRIEKALVDNLYSESDFKDVSYTNRQDILANSDIIIQLTPPSLEDISAMKKGVILFSILDPFNNSQLLDAIAQKEIQCISMEMIPRTTLAQKMDVLSSQASLAGYIAVMLAAQFLPKIYPLMMTPSGTIKPSRIFIIGAGVAGLQAIATAKRLGARVDAFDTRPVVEEQVLSLGAKFVKVDLGETGQTKDGYAKELSSDQLKRQQEVMTKQCSMSDVVITTAQLFGKKAPTIITEDMLSKMKPGTVVMDLAIDSGGNVEGSKLNEVVEKNGVKIVGYPQLARRIPLHASEMLAANFKNYIEHAWNTDSKTLELNLEDEIIQGSLLTQKGHIIHQQFQKKDA